MPDAIARIRTLRELLPPDVFIQVDGGVGPGERPRALPVGREPARRGDEHLRQGGSAARVPAPRHQRSRDDMTMRRAIELAERGRGTTYPNPLVGAVVVQRRRGRRRGLARAARRAARGGERAARRGRARARFDDVRLARAVHASRIDAAVRRRDPRSGRRARRRRRARSEPERQRRRRRAAARGGRRRRGRRGRAGVARARSQRRLALGARARPAVGDLQGRRSRSTGG